MSRLCPKPGVQKLSINQLLQVNGPLKSVIHQNCEDNRALIDINEFLKDVGGHSSLVFRDYATGAFERKKYPHLWEATSLVKMLAFFPN